jgi:hypothetical protein
MSHAPVQALQRMLDTLVEVPRNCVTAYTLLQEQAGVGGGGGNNGNGNGEQGDSSEVLAPSSKRRLILSVEADVLPATLACSSATLVALMLLWEQLLRKAHPNGECIDSSFDPSSLDLLRRDRGISRLLKKGAAALARLRVLLPKQQWQPTLLEWARMMDAIEEWRGAQEEGKGGR